MSADLDGPTRSKLVVDFEKWFGAVVVVVALTLVSLGEWPDAVGVLLGSMLLLAVTRHVGKTFRPRTANSRPKGFWIMAALTVPMGATMLFIGVTVGGTFVVILLTAVGTWTLGNSAFLIAVAKPLHNQT